MRAWVFLFAAICFEVIGTTSIKYLMVYFPFLGYLFMYGMIAMSYFFLALAVKNVPLGVAYALWEGIGIVLVTAVSVFCFGESLGVYKVIGLGLIITGALLIKSGGNSHRSGQTKTKRPLTYVEA